MTDGQYPDAGDSIVEGIREIWKTVSLCSVTLPIEVTILPERMRLAINTCRSEWRVDQFAMMTTRTAPVARHDSKLPMSVGI